MDRFEEFLPRVEEMFARLEEMPPEIQEDVWDLLDDVDFLHRTAVQRLARQLDPETVGRLAEEPFVAWLFEAYGVLPGPAPPSVPVQIRRRGCGDQA